MFENKDRNGFARDTVLPSEFLVGSDESRAAARALLDNFGGPPDIQVSFVSRPEEPQIHEIEFAFGKPVACDSHRATCDGREWLRNHGESLQAFKCRIDSDLPIGGFPKLIVFWPDEDSSENDTTNSQSHSGTR
jgi:hypothetical protein